MKKFTKRFLLTVVPFAVATSILFAGCDSSAPASSQLPSDTSSTSAAAPSGTAAEPAFQGSDNIPVVDGVAEMMMGATTTGGWTYMYVSSAAKVISDHCENINVTPQITTGGGENLVRVAAGELPVGVASAAYIDKYLNGSPEEKIEACPQLRTLYGSPNSTLSVIVPAGSSYQTIEDLKGKKVSICNKGNSGQLLIADLLKAMGRDDGYYDLQYLTPAESMDALKTGNIESLWICACDPHSSVTEIFTMPGGARFIEFSDEQKKLFLDTCSYLSPAVRPAGTYTGQTEEYHSVGSPYALIVTEDFPEELAYQMAKALNENYDEWVTTFAGVKGATAQNTIDTAIAPLHPGTERYFKEIGLLK